MVDTPLNKRIRTYLKAAAQRYKRRHKWQNAVISTVTIAALVVSLLPDGRVDTMRIVGLGLACWGLYFLMAPLRRRAQERYFQRERAHFLQIVPASSPAFPNALSYLLECGLHTSLARDLASNLPGGPELLATTGDGAVWFGDEAESQTAAPEPEASQPAPAAGKSVFDSVFPKSFGPGISPEMEAILKGKGFPADGSDGLPEELEKMIASYDGQAVITETTGADGSTTKTVKVVKTSKSGKSGKAAPKPAAKAKPKKTKPQAAAAEKRLDFIPLDPFDD